MRTTSSSYSRRLAGVSGMTTTVFGAVTRKNVRVAPATVLERVLERGVAQVDGDRRLAERRVEDQADVGEPRDRREDVAAAGVAEDERRRHLDVLRQVEPRRRQVARPLDERLQLGLAFARDRDLGAQLVARRPQLLVDVAAGRVQLGRRARTRPAPDRTCRSAASRRPRVEVILRRRAASRARAPSRASASSGRRRSALVYSTTARS